MKQVSANVRPTSGEEGLQLAEQGKDRADWGASSDNWQGYELPGASVYGRSVYFACAEDIKRLAEGGDARRANR